MTTVFTLSSKHTNGPMRVRVVAQYFLKLDKNAELAQAVNLMMTQEKRIYIYICLFYIHMFSVFVLSYGNTCESLGELKKAVEICQLVFPQHFSFVPN